MADQNTTRINMITIIVMIVLAIIALWFFFSAPRLDNVSGTTPKPTIENPSPATPVIKSSTTKS